MMIWNVRTVLVGLVVAATFLPLAAEAHVLPGDPHNFEAQLASCDLDLFRTQRPDGTYYATLGNDALAEQFYPLIFRQQFRKRNPFPTRNDDGLAQRLAPQMIDITLNLAYADALPSRSRRTARLRALLTALVSEVQPHILRSVVGPDVGRARRIRRQTGLRQEWLGAAVLARTMMDVYDRVPWGPSFVVDHKLPQLFDSSGWSLDGAPLPAAQFDLLVTDARSHLQGLDAKQKSSFVGGSCLHTHPTVLTMIFANDEENAIAIDECEEDPACTNVIGELTFLERVSDFLFGRDVNPPAGGGGATDAGGSDGDGGGTGGAPGGGRPGDVPHPDADPDDQPTECGGEYADRPWLELGQTAVDWCSADIDADCVAIMNHCVAELEACEEQPFSSFRCKDEWREARDCVVTEVFDHC